MFRIRRAGVRAILILVALGGAAQVRAQQGDSPVAVSPQGQGADQPAQAAAPQGTSPTGGPHVGSTNATPPASHSDAKPNTVHFPLVFPLFAPQSAITFWTTMAHNAPLKTRYGHTYDRDLYIYGIERSVPIVSGRHGTLEYTNDLLPLVVSTEMPYYRDTTILRECGPHLPLQCEPKRQLVALDSLIETKHTIYGTGIIPIGFRYVVGPRPVQFLLGFSVGAVYFQHRIPDPSEMRFNFTLDGTGLFRVAIGKRNGITAGYHFNHMSNANTGHRNPGMNSVTWDFGWTVFSTARARDSQSLPLHGQ